MHLLAHRVCHFAAAPSELYSTPAHRFEALEAPGVTCAVLARHDQGEGEGERYQALRCAIPLIEDARQPAIKRGILTFTVRAALRAVYFLLVPVVLLAARHRRHLLPPRCRQPTKLKYRLPLLRLPRSLTSLTRASAGHGCLDASSPTEPIHCHQVVGHPRPSLSPRGRHAVIGLLLAGPAASRAPRFKCRGPRASSTRRPFSARRAVVSAL